MKKIVLLTTLFLCACNTTPETVIDDALPGLESTPKVENNSTTPAKTEPSQTSPENTAADAEKTEAEAPPETANEETVEAVEENLAPETVVEDSMENTEANGLVFLKEGTFQDAVHIVSGDAKIVKSGDQFIARLENFQTENGPGLHVYLMKDPAGSDNQGFIDLGALKGTQGNQNYDIPAGTDVSEYQALTIWCQPFRVNFGFATLLESK